ncbi:NADH-quinone oxidoreductase subunit C [Reichenbachiella agarivorans]|uniref:NADH-quinone oxidoreductase subunit C n=1 Tax=Reichenbachiella agarivorans TaxID=2979464 RepID=A0ABY6CQR2_9BACT|nr:NADH-quinone oxidoreductase subunit C [Reichenbachiella agarivorans]UXP32851.1 NADH-quinone oxidoreductase subunit C [Reichenbachiella agarivorans]
MEIAEFKLLVQDRLGESAVLSIDENATPKALIVAANQIKDICAYLRDNDQSYFDMLSCLTAIDNGPEANTMEVVYNLYSIPLEQSLMLKTFIPRDNPELETVCDIWKTANWHEREAFDLFGVKFSGHPDMRRILMPADWVGYPMRKDYIEPEEYRGMKTIREEGDPS